MNDELKQTSLLNEENKALIGEPLSKEEERLIVMHTISHLYKDDKTVRDPVHGDILLNHLEVRVIDTEMFQRLRKIRQLGTSYLVYPGAEHSRFQHSIGTLHMTHTLLQHVSTNRFSQYTVFSDDSDENLRELQDKAFRLVVRLAALLHDFQEFPFSHTLEKEGNIFKGQWKDKSLNCDLLGKDSEVYKAIFNYIYEFLKKPILDDAQEVTYSADKMAKVESAFGKLEEKRSFAERLARTIIVFAYMIILEGKAEEKTKGKGEEKTKGKETDKPNEVELAEELFETKEIIEYLVDKKFLIAGSQLVSNTICADLLDYLSRDFFFSGIKKTYDERFLKYAVVCDNGELKPCPVFAYRVITRTGEIRNSVLSSLFDLIELRYSLAELVHTHKTKNSFSAMVIEAFNYYYQSLSEEEQKEFNKMVSKMGDDELLAYLRSENPTSKYILDYYFQRRPYKEYLLWDSEALGNPELIWQFDLKSDNGKSISYLRDNPKERLYLESLLSKSLSDLLKINLQEGSCLIYVMPPPKKLYKEMETYVVYTGEQSTKTVSKLSALGGENTSSDQPLLIEMGSIIRRIKNQRQNLRTKYADLWHVSLFLIPKIEEIVLDVNYVANCARDLIESFFKKLGYQVNIKKGDIPSCFNGAKGELMKKVEDSLDLKKRAQGENQVEITFENIWNSLFPPKLF